MTSRTPIRTLIGDDHPAMRAGVAAVLGHEPDFALVGAASGARQLWRALRNADADVVLMDFALDGADGVILCHRLKRRPDAPRVVLYSAFAAPTLPADAREQLGATLDADELSLAALLLARRPFVHIAEVTGIAVDDLGRVIEDLLRRLVAAV